ncbi:heterokaryon incompatibility protein-domain-containing protein, partial [Immersiella caudata]
MPLSEGNVAKIRKAIKGCTRRHRLCPDMEEGVSPLRLLNVMHENSIKLEDTNGAKRAYAALSYCWGDSEAMEVSKTTSKNLESRRLNFSINSLPQTLQDAILVARLLNVRYVWIDAICIVQDDAKEFIQESQKMMEYYGNAIFTIVPLLSRSADDGMRLGSDTPFSSKLRGPRILARDLVLADMSQDYWCGPENLSKFAWSYRGWTYQEKLNSSRILFLCRGATALVCREGAWDTLRGWIPNKWDPTSFLPIKKLPAEADGDWVASYQTWCQIVTNYTERKLSDPRDRFFAFSGIAKAYSEFFGRSTLVGLHQARIMEELVSWGPISWGPPDYESGFPSWTW